MNFLEKANDFIRKIEEFILSGSVILMAVILVANVVGRVLFKHSLNFAEEVSSILTVFLTFAGVSYCARIGRHINMTALFDALPRTGKKAFLYISSTITFIAFMYLAYLSTNYVITICNTGRYTSALQIPLWIPYLMLPIGFFLAGIQYIFILIMNIRDKNGVYTSIIQAADDFDTDVTTENEIMTEEADQL